MMRSITAVAVSAYRGGLDFDVCPPVQEDLDGPEMASLSSPVERRRSKLSDTHRETTLNTDTRNANSIDIHA
jgi:hypothetical protein